MIGLLILPLPAIEAILICMKTLIFTCRISQFYIAVPF